MDTKEALQLSEQYLTGQLKGEKLTAFKAKMEADPSFAQEIQSMQRTLQIDQYLNGELEGEELTAFESKMETDSELLKELDLQKNLPAAFVYKAQTSVLKETLQQIKINVEESKNPKEEKLRLPNEIIFRPWRLVATIIAFFILLTLLLYQIFTYKSIKTKLASEIQIKDGLLIKKINERDSLANINSLLIIENSILKKGLDSLSKVNQDVDLTNSHSPDLPVKSSKGDLKPVANNTEPPPPQAENLFTQSLELENIADKNFSPEPMDISESRFRSLDQELDTFYIKAASYYMTGKFGEALNVLDQITTRNPKDFESHLYKGICYLALDDPANAIGAFQIIKDKGSESTSWVKIDWYMALALLKVNKIEEARNLLSIIVSKGQPFKSKDAERLLQELEGFPE